MFSQVVPMISSFATQCASVEFETILSRDLVNVLVQLLVLLSACKHQVNNYLKGGQAKHIEILVFWQHNFQQTNIYSFGPSVSYLFFQLTVTLPLQTDQLSHARHFKRALSEPHLAVFSMFSELFPTDFLLEGAAAAILYWWWGI